jgi:Stage II sporulation protein E (SpoIIE)
MVLQNKWQSLRRLSLSQAVERVGATPDDTDEIRLQKTLVFVFACAMSLAGIVWGFLAYLVYQSALAALPPFGYAILSLVNVVIFASIRRFRLFSFIQLFLTLVLPVLMMVALGGFVNGSATILWSLIAPLGALVVAGRHQATLWFLAFLGLVLFSGFLEPAIRPTREVPLLVQTILFVMNIGGVSAVAFILLSYFVGQRKKLQDLERAYLQQELSMARDIQQALLPKDVPQLAGWKISCRYQPATEVGGDFYDFLELEDGRLGVVVGDATGHGMPAALVMATARSMLRAVAQASESPGEVLRRANDPLFTDIPPNMFITCFYAILDPESGSLTYANAGHDLPYLHRNGGAEELRARGMPLGLMPDMSYEEQEVTLEAGDSALFYSDGLVEAHDHQRREMFGFPRLRELVAEHGEDGSLGDLLLEELYAFTGDGWDQEDDITLVTLRRAPVSR